jgi:hypothetical protein
MHNPISSIMAYHCFLQLNQIFSNIIFSLLMQMNITTHVLVLRHDRGNKSCVNSNTCKSTHIFVCQQLSHHV